MMPMQAWSHESEGPKIRLFWSALKAWFLCVTVCFLLVASRENLLPPSDDPDTTRLLDAVTLAAVAIGTALLFLRRQHMTLSHWRALAVSVFWVGLSTLSQAAYPVFMEGRYTLRFLLRVMMGDSDPLQGWVWQVFLTAQLTGLPALTFLQAFLARLRAADFSPFHSPEHHR